MKFTPRDDQAGKFVGYSLFSFTPNDETPDRDAYFDGTPVGNKSLARHWIEENDVHQAPALSHSVDSNRVFLGPQGNTVLHTGHTPQYSQYGLSVYRIR